MKAKVLALIPARGGSQGIPRKNIRVVGGKPLLVWSLQSAKDSGIFDDVWVSTDDEEIAKIALEHGALVHSRDPSTATCTATTESVISDFLATHDAHTLCLIQPTSPLTIPRYFQEALQQYNQERATSLVTVTRKHLFLWSKDGVPLNYDPANRPRRQDFDGSLVENGAFYFMNVEQYLRVGNRLCGKRAVFEMPACDSVDVDEIHDLWLCDSILRNRQIENPNNSKPCYVHNVSDGVTVGRRATAPLRIDLAGGWTDAPQFAEKYGGEVVSFAVKLYTEAQISIDPVGRLSASYSSEVPMGTGLGTSGSLNVALIAVCQNSIMDKLQLAEKAYKFEWLLGNIGGRQDQLCAAFGGFNRFSLHTTVSYEQLAVPSEMRSWLSENLLLFDSQLRHNSGELHTKIWARFQRGDDEVKRGLMLLKRCVSEMIRSLLDCDRQGIATIMRNICAGVDLLSKEINAPFCCVLEPLMEFGHIDAWKAVGAGAGGCVVVLLRRATERGKVQEHCERNGWSHIEWEYDFEGVQLQAF